MNHFYNFFLFVNHNRACTLSSTVFIIHIQLPALNASFQEQIPSIIHYMHAAKTDPGTNMQDRLKF